MRLNEIDFDDQPPVDSYGPGFFRVQEDVREGGILILNGDVATWHGFEDPDPIVTSAGDYDVIFIGTGAEIAPLPKDFKSAMERAGVPFEVMASPAACRTYNVLLSEGRRVAIAAVPV